MLFFLLKFYCKCYTQLKVTAELLDGAPNAVDDLYEGCREQVSQDSVISKLLEEEKNRSLEFQEAWHRATTCPYPKPKTMSTLGLLAYFSGNDHFIKSFNNAVKTQGFNDSTYKNQFHFKSLHFLLMDSMIQLSPDKCRTLHALPEEQYTAKKGSQVRFGQFTTVYSSYSDLKNMDGIEVLFNITTCFFAKIETSDCTDVGIALLSPAEVFIVEDVKEVNDSDGSKHTEVILKHSKVHSSHNCLLFPR